MPFVPQPLPRLLDTHMRVMLVLPWKAFTSREPRMAETCAEGSVGVSRGLQAPCPSPEGCSASFLPWGPAGSTREGAAGSLGMPQEGMHGVQEARAPHAAASPPSLSHRDTPSPASYVRRR